MRSPSAATGPLPGLGGGATCEHEPRAVLSSPRNGALIEQLLLLGEIGLAGDDEMVLTS